MSKILMKPDSSIDCYQTTLASKPIPDKKKQNKNHNWFVL